SEGALNFCQAAKPSRGWRGLSLALRPRYQPRWARFKPIGLGPRPRLGGALLGKAKALGLVAAVEDVLPPGAIIQIPAHRLGETTVGIFLRLPPELPRECR